MAETLEVLAILFGVTALVTLPLAVIIGLPLLAWNGRAFLRLKERELDLRRLEVTEHLRLARLERIPAYVDPKDPEQLLAWTRTDQELELLSGPDA